ncbi:MAG: hypothetical protein AB7J32_12495 [Pseudonocardia sp.]
MLKKAGIVAVAVVAGLLSVSPLAFAGSREVDDTSQVNRGDEVTGLVNVTGNNVVVPVNVCNNDVPVNGAGGQVPANDSDPTIPLQGALGLLSNIDQDQDTNVNSGDTCDADGDAGDVQVNDND